MIHEELLSMSEFHTKLKEYFASEKDGDKYNIKSISKAYFESFELIF